MPADALTETGIAAEMCWPHDWMRIIYPDSPVGQDTYVCKSCGKRIVTELKFELYATKPEPRESL